MSEHKVFCAKIETGIARAPRAPFDSDLGKKIYEQISQQAWGQWMEQLQDVAERISPEPGAQTGSGSSS